MSYPPIWANLSCRPPIPNNILYPSLPYPLLPLPHHTFPSPTNTHFTPRWGAYAPYTPTSPSIGPLFRPFPRAVAFPPPLPTTPFVLFFLSKIEAVPEQNPSPLSPPPYYPPSPLLFSRPHDYPLYFPKTTRIYGGVSPLRIYTLLRSRRVIYTESPVVSHQTIWARIYYRIYEIYLYPTRLLGTKADPR
jgi:hypothetical protein